MHPRFTINQSMTHLRTIRSFVRREGRLTAGQQRALDELFPLYGIALEKEPAMGTQSLARALTEYPSATLEIGFGNGESLLEQAARNPERLFIGIEVHRPGAGHLLQRIGLEGLKNLRVICHDAVEVLKSAVPDDSLDTLQLFFPDPWHKKRHHKRRIVQPAFVELVHRTLKPGGLFHLATDWEDYALWMREVLEAANGFENTAGAGRFTERPDSRPPTKFERRGQRLGHGVRDLVYQKVRRAM